MGILARGRETIEGAGQTALTEAARQRNQAREGVLAEIREIQTQPVFAGDPETALVHHFGEEALYESEIEPYIDLLRRIQEHQAEDGATVPVLVEAAAALDEVGRLLGRSTTLLSIDPNQVELQSRIKVERDQRVHAFTSETADIATRELLIRGLGSEVQGGLLQGDDPGTSPDVQRFSWWKLRKIVERTDGFGAGFSSDYAFRNYGEGRLQPEAEPIVLVGEEEIASALLERISRTTSSDIRAAEVLRVQRFLGHLYDKSTVEKILECSPDLKSMVRAAATLRVAIGGLAESE